MSTTNIAAELDELLKRCEALRRGSEIGRPTMFDAAGEAHAKIVAAADTEGAASQRR